MKFQFIALLRHSDPGGRAADPQGPRELGAPQADGSTESLGDPGKIPELSGTEDQDLGPGVLGDLPRKFQALGILDFGEKKDASPKPGQRPLREAQGPDALAAASRKTGVRGSVQLYGGFLRRGLEGPAQTDFEVPER